MKEQCTIDVSMKHYIDKCRVVLWEHGDRFPELGPSVGVDTETELFTDAKKDPPIVVLGVFDPWHQVCYIIYWEDVTEFMHQLNMTDAQQRYFNLGYDEPVISNEDPDKTLLEAIEQGRVRDMQIRMHLYAIATVGWIPAKLYSLAGCSQLLLNVKLDKGDPNDPENSARMTFRRYNKDGSKYRITAEQAKYLPYDCMTTWCLGEELPEQPTEIQHTKGMVVQAHTSINGMQVDQRVFDALEKQLMDARDRYRQQLLAYGFPDPYKDDKKEAETIRQKLYDEAALFVLRTTGNKLEWGVCDGEDGAELSMPSKERQRVLLTYMYNFESEPADATDFSDAAVFVLSGNKVSFGKKMKDMWADVVEKYDLLAFDQSKRAIVMQAFTGKVLEHLNGQQIADVKQHGWDLDGAQIYASEYMDEHPDWLTAVKTIGPKKFFQDHAKEVCDRNPDLKLEKTKKSGDIKLTLKDRWRQEDANVTDGFLDSYINFNHCQKYLSTYLNRGMIASDGRMHPKFTNIQRTGRTSCTAPNQQNLPSRDKVYPQKNMFAPFPGMQLCATDFSFIEWKGTLLY